MNSDFLFSLENNLNLLFKNNGDFEFHKIYTNIYRETFKIIKIKQNDIIFSDVLEYINKILEKIFKSISSDIQNNLENENILDFYIQKYKKTNQNLNTCFNLFEFYITKNEKPKYYFNNLGKKLWKDIVYGPIEQKMNIILVNIIEKNQEKEDFSVILLIREYFRILNSLNKSESEYSIKSNLMVNFFNNYLNIYFVSKLKKCIESIEKNLYTFTVFETSYYAIFIQNNCNLKKYGIESFIYENYFLTQSTLRCDAVKCLLEKELPLILEKHYLLEYNKFMEHIALNLNEHITRKLQNFIYLYLENFYDEIQTVIVSFIQKKIDEQIKKDKDNDKDNDKDVSMSDFEIIFFNSLFIEILLGYLHKKKIENTVNILGYKCSIKKLQYCLKIFFLNRISEFEKRNLLYKISNFIVKYTYNNLYMRTLILNSLKSFFHVIKEEDAEEYLIYYKSFMLKRIEKIEHDSKLETELFFIKGLQCKYDFPILSRLKIIIDDYISSEKLLREFNSKQKNSLKNIDLLIETYGIWERGFCDKKIDLDSYFLSFTNQFSEFYNSKYENRNLKWNNNATSTNIIFNTNENQIILNNCSLVETSILLKFNKIKSISFHNLKSKNQNSYEMLKKIKILACDKKNMLYSVNNNFTCKEKTIDFSRVRNQFLKFKSSRKQKNVDKRTKEKDDIVFCKRTRLNLYIVRTLKNTENHTRNRYDFLKEILKKFDEIYEIEFINESFNILNKEGYIKFENNNVVYF